MCHVWCLAALAGVLGVTLHASLEVAHTTVQPGPLFGSLAQMLHLPCGFFIAADDAYPASDQLLTPWPGKKLSQFYRFN